MYVVSVKTDFFYLFFLGKHRYVSNMRYYKPMMYSAVVIIYASLGFRIFRLSYISQQLGQQGNVRKTQSGSWYASILSAVLVVVVDRLVS